MTPGQPDILQASTAALDVSRAETRAAFENRALMYSAIFDELEAELGIERAADIMKRAIYKRGVEIGQVYREAVEARDLDEVGRIFVENSPAQGSFFRPAIEEQPKDGRIVLKMMGCPLADAWRDAGLGPDKVDLLCDIAAAVDHGTFEGAGLDLEFLDRQACAGSEKCLLALRLRD